MAKFSITEFFKGINTRINKFRIGSSEAVNSENVDLSTIELKPQKGLDTSDTTFNSVDYKFKSYDISDSSAIKFTESGDLVIKSYGDADPKFDRIYYNSSGVAQDLVGEKDLGVPAKPPTPSPSIVTSGTVGGTAQAFSSITTSTYNSTGIFPSTDNSDIKSLPTSGAIDHTQGTNPTGRIFTVFKRYGNTLVMFDPTNSKLKRVDATTGNTPSGVTPQELTITHSAKYFFSGDYFVGLDANYDNVSIVDTAYGGNTENTYSTNSQPTYTAYNSSTRTPGIGSLSLLDKSVGVNDDYLFIAKNYRANRYSYKARETSWVNSTSSYYYPAYHPLRLDRPVFYLYAGWSQNPNSWNNIEASSVLGSSNSITIDEGYLQFFQKYYNLNAGFGRWFVFNQYEGLTDTYLFISINGVRYTARVIYELVLWQNSGYYADYASSISHNNSTLNNYCDYWRKDKTHATWIFPFYDYGETNDLDFYADLDIQANAMTSVSGTFYDNGDHTNGTHTNVPLMEATGEYTHVGYSSSGYPQPTHFPISQNPWSVSSVSPTNYQRGLLAKGTVVVSNGSVQSVTVTDGGRGWQVGDVFEMPTVGGVPFYSSASGSNKHIGGTAGAYGTVTAIDNSLAVKVGTNTPLSMDLSNGQVTNWHTSNWGAASSNTAPVAISMYQPDNKMSIGGVTRLALSGGATIFKNFSDNIDTIPTQYGDLGAQYDTGGMNDYKPKYPIDNRRNDADYSPLRDNFLLQEKNYAYLSKSSISYVNVDGWYGVTGKTYLISDQSNNNFSDATFAIPTNSPSYSIADTNETPITSSGGGIASGWYTMEATGLSASNDGVFNNAYGGNIVYVHRNILSAGSTQFGNVQATLTLPISGYDKVRQDGFNAVYINSAENISDSVAVVSLQTLTVVNGASFYGYADGADDIYKEGNFVFVSRGTNGTVVVNSAGNNEIAPVSAGMEYIVKVDTSNRIVYGLTVDGGKGKYVKSQYFFFPSEILALTTGGIWDNRKNASYNETINMVMRGYANNTANDNYTILFSHDGDASFQTDDEAYHLNIGTNRTPKIIATPVTKGTFTAIPGSGNVAWNGTTLSYVPNDAMHQCQIGDLIDLAPASGNFSYAVTYKISAYASATSLTLTGPVSGSALANSASGANQLFNVKRYVSRNRYFALTTTFSGLSIPSSLPTFVTNGAYSGVDEMISFDDLPSTTKFIPHANSSSDAYTADGNTYYYTDLDRNITDTSGVDVGEDTFTYGGLDIYNSEGANIPFQYKVSYLRDVKHTSESEPVLIEGPTSDETQAITLSNVTQSISLASIGGNELSAQGSEIAKVRVYRVGGDYARYYWLADLDVATNGSVTDYSDISLAVGSTLITPNSATAPPVDKLTNIVNANGFFVGSVGSKIYVSEFGNPHSYPESGQYDIDGNINHIEEVEGEAVVFTDNMIYRVRGFNFDSMNIASIPQNQGVSSENQGSVVKYLGSVYFISNDGLCEYRSGSVRILSHNKFEKFPTITSPKSAFKDGVLYIFESNPNSSNLGVKVDLRGSDPVFSRISQKASNRALYNKINDTLYVKDSAGSGSYGSSGDDLSITHDSGVISFGDLYSTKAVFGITVKYKTSTNPSNSSGQIKLYDHADTNFFTGTLANSTDETCLYFPFSNYSLVKYLRYKVTGEVTIYEIVFEQEPVETFINKMRFNYTDVQYIGDDMKVDLYVDNAIQTSNPNYATAGSTSLPTSSGNVKTVRLHYPKDVVGYIPHIYYTGTGRVLSYKYGTEDI